MSSACDRRAVLASTCNGGTCPKLPGCDAAQQQFPETCDQDAGLCHGVLVESDEVICDRCYDLLDRRNIGSPLGPCACTYCGLQLTACFASAETELDGDPTRDRHCQAIVECAWSVGCAGSDCYCGVGVDRDTCLKNANEGKAGGPCAPLIEAAVECESDAFPGACVLSFQVRRDTVLHRVSELAECVSGDPLMQASIIEPKCQ
jgi:hypothetical protein